MIDDVSSESPADYCRQIESYLCRKNDGHLIRIVGPAFEQVCGWASRGVPIKVAFRGIDRYFERYYARGPRRRPIRVEFCEADVLDVFDEWRRAVGVPAPSGADEVAEQRRHGSLPAHLDRAIARLTALQAGPNRALAAVIEPVVRELDAAKAGAKTVRGEARQQLLQRLTMLEAELVDAARRQLDADGLSAITAEAEQELAPFRERMPADAYERARLACVDRIIRVRANLPVLTFE